MLADAEGCPKASGEGPVVAVVTVGLASDIVQATEGLLHVLIDSSEEICEEAAAASSHPQGTFLGIFLFGIVSSSSSASAASMPVTMPVTMLTM